MTGQGDSSSDTYHFIKKECYLHDIKLITLSFFNGNMKTTNWILRVLLSLNKYENEENHLTTICKRDYNQEQQQ